jgi:hypothetical protein
VPLFYCLKNPEALKRKITLGMSESLEAGLSCTLASLIRHVFHLTEENVEKAHIAHVGGIGLSPGKLSCIVDTFGKQNEFDHLS